MQKQLTHNEHTVSSNLHDIIVICDHLTGPANIGSMFRLCDAFGIKELVFVGTTPDLKSNRLKRTARNTQNTVNFKSDADITTLLDLEKKGYTFIGIEITNTSVPITNFEIPNSKKMVLIIGNEQQGISKELLALCTTTCHIHMHGANSSMNVSHAAAIALYDITTKVNSTK